MGFRDQIPLGLVELRCDVSKVLHRAFEAPMTQVLGSRVAGHWVTVVAVRCTKEV